MPSEPAAGSAQVRRRRWRVVPGWMRSIRFRITVTAVLVIAALLAITGWLLTRSIEDTQLAQIRDRTETTLDDVVGHLEDGSAPATALRDAEPADFIQILDDDGDPVASAIGTAAVNGYVVSSGRAAVEAPAGATGDERSLETGGGSGVEEFEPTSDTLTAIVTDNGPHDHSPVVERAASVAIEVTDERASEVERLAKPASTDDGELLVVAYAPVDEVGRSMSAVRRGLFIAGPGLIALAAVLTWLLVGRSLRPVETIRSEVESIGGATIDRRVPEHGAHDEVSKLAHTMNAMLDRLDRSATRQREFISDASHELRSPVASIRTNLEVALRQTDTASWPDVAREVLDDEARLETLLDDLLLLAAADEDRPVEPKTQVNLTTLAHDEVSAARPFPAEVTAETPGGPVEVAANPHELRRVLTNLVDNAARHARDEIRIRLGAADDMVRIDVDDDGPGVPAADRDRIFERFVRLDEGRSRDEGGTGLGLAVATSIITRHGGTIEVTDSPLGGARFTVLLPAAGSHADEMPVPDDGDGAGAGNTV